MSNPSPVCQFAPVKQLIPNPTTFRPGVSGNPNGRPERIKYISEHIYDLIKRPEKPNAQTIALSMVTEASNGNMVAAKEILDRIEGKVPQAIDLSSRSLNIEVAASYAVVNGAGHAADGWRRDNRGCSPGITA